MLIDSDPQGNSSSDLGIDSRSLEHSGLPESNRARTCGYTSHRKISSAPAMPSDRRHDVTDPSDTQTKSRKGESIMKMLRKLFSAFLFVLLCICVFGGFTVPPDSGEELVTVYCNDGKILYLPPDAAKDYSDSADWSEDFLEVTCDIWNTAGDNRLLTILEEEDVKATFFMLGNRAQSGADRIRRMQSLGMELGSHTYDHTQLTKLDESALADQIEKTNAAIMNAAGTAPTLLRPPYGSYNAAGVPIVLWSLDSQDWKNHSADAVYQKVLIEVQDGSVILFHDIYDTSVDAAKRLIPALKERGYEMVTVSELAKRKGKTLSPGDVFSKG